MSRVVFMCGPAGSGKSTIARRFEAEGFVRLSFDQEAWRRGHRTMPLPQHVHAAIDADLRRELRALVKADRDVVLDFSFWSRAMRDDWRADLAPLGIVPETVHVQTDRWTSLRRLRQRAAAHADDFELDDAIAVAYHDQFEPPTPDEGPLTVVSGA